MRVNFFGLSIIDDNKYLEIISTKNDRGRLLCKLRNNRKYLSWAIITILALFIIRVIIGLYFWAINILSQNNVSNIISVDMAILFVLLYLSTLITFYYNDLQIKILQTNNPEE